MTIRFVVNIALLAIPIAVTLGILFGIQGSRTASGLPPLFAPPVDNGITKTRYCQRSFGIEPKTKGQQFTLNPNQWNVKDGTPGSLCLNVTTFNNKTYASDITAPQFMVTWQYPPGPEDSPVYAFPNIKVDSTVFPAALNDLKKASIDVEWTYGIGNETKTGASQTDWTADALNANVAIDMFIDSDKDNAMDPTKAKYELMVWFAAIGPATQPLGFHDSVVSTQTIDGATFSLYVGANSLGQSVLTWYSATPVQKFNGDISPLINELFKLTVADLPKNTDYLGYLALGSETLSATKTVTFYVPQLSIDIETSTSNSTQH